MIASQILYPFAQFSLAILDLDRVTEDKRLDQSFLNKHTINALTWTIAPILAVTCSVPISYQSVPGKEFFSECE